MVAPGAGWHLDYTMTTPTNPGPADPPNVARSRVVPVSLRELLVAAGLGVTALGASHCDSNPFTRYMRRSRTTEAVDKLGWICRGMTTYATSQRFMRSRGAAVVTPQFPVSAPRTPANV